jgi:hypothetical protein
MIDKLLKNTAHKLLRKPIISSAYKGVWLGMEFEVPSCEYARKMGESPNDFGNFSEYRSIVGNYEFEMKVDYSTGNLGPQSYAHKRYEIRVFGDTPQDAPKQEIISCNKTFNVNPHTDSLRPDRDEFSVWYNEAITNVKDAFNIYLGIAKSEQEQN